MDFEQQVRDILNENDLLNEFPSDYLETLVNSIEKAFEIFKNDILSITLGGSGGKNLIHEGWSDLDLYFIIKEYSLSKICKYNELINSFNNIHIGTSFYTLKEVENEMISVNTKVMIYEKYKYNLNPTLYGNNYYKDISYETVRNNDIYNLPNILFDYKKIILDIKSGNTKPSRMCIKKMLILLKSVLNYHNIFSFGYEEVILKFSRLCLEKGYKFNKKSGLDIILLIDDFKNIEKYENEIIDYSEEIFEFIDKYC